METKPTDSATYRNVLDHGYVRLLNLSGPVRRKLGPFDASDVDPAKTARISFGNLHDDRKEATDLKLVKYLIEHKHWTPVEMIECYFEMKLPIFVARQFVRHRTACINEISGRYVELPEEFYIPDVVGGKPVNGAKQGQSDTRCDEEQVIDKRQMRDACEHSFSVYKSLLASDVAPEHARMVLPLNTYTHWVWKQDLRNMLGFIKLRMDGHAQVEAQAYAKAIFEILKRNLPDIMEIWEGTSDS